MWCEMLSLTACSMLGISFRNRAATLTSASLGHWWNQSMLVQLTSPGNVLDAHAEGVAGGGEAEDNVEVWRTRSMKNSII